MQASTQQKIKFFDPHFHLLDLETENGVHKEQKEFWQRVYPKRTLFLMKDYEEMIMGEQDEVELIGGVFMEAVAAPHRRIDEAKWVQSELDKSSLPYGLVAGCDLSQDVLVNIMANTDLKSFRGFRELMNKGDWSAKTSRLHEETTQKNLKLMEASGLSYGLGGVDPSLYQLAADVLDTVPNLIVIIDHRGMPRSIEALQSKEYWDGMKRFAAMPKVYMKISFFAQTDPDWNLGNVVIEKAVELIKLFGANRCMFATNFPVDNADRFSGGWTMKKMIETFKEIARNFTEEEQARLWRETAIEAYKMGDLVKI